MSGEDSFNLIFIVAVVVYVVLRVLALWAYLRERRGDVLTLNVFATGLAVVALALAVFVMHSALSAILWGALSLVSVHLTRSASRRLSGRN